MNQKEYLTTWRKNNSEHLKNYNKSPERHAKNKEHYKKWISRNKEKMKEYLRDYSKKHSYKYVGKKYKVSEKSKMSIANSRHKRRLAIKITDITSAWLKQLWETTTHCVLCGKQMENNGKYPDGKHLDHISPINVGGLHVMNNVRYICAKCNINRPKDGSDNILVTGESS